MYLYESISSGLSNKDKKGIIEAIERTSKKAFRIIDNNNIIKLNLLLLGNICHKFLIK